MLDPRILGHWCKLILIMKKFFVFILFFLFSSSVFGEYLMERVICTTKKTSNCGAYIYNSKTGEVYFCDSEKCKEVDTPIEIIIEQEDEDDGPSLIPKKPKKKESKIPKKPKKKESKIPKKPDKCDKESKIPKKGCS